MENTNPNSYNGWTNYQTWVVNLWLTNDSGSSDYWNEQAREALESNDCDKDSAASDLANMLESEHDDAMPEVTGVFSDLLGHALGSVDWREIAESLLSEIDVYSAGWNMPGYMPESEPALFLDESCALEYIKDAAKDCIDEDMTEEEQEDAESDIEDWESDKNGEFGQTFGKFHYFITRV